MFVRLVVIAVIAALAWGASVRPSSGSDVPRTYVVRPYDTLWSIAASHYAGDPREAVWRLRELNRLRTTTLLPGQRLVLP